MAKSFINQLFDLVGLKLPDAQGHYSPSAYRDEPSKAEQEQAKMTGVARYLANNYPEEQADVSETAKLTGVAKYLAKIQQEEQEQVEAEAAAQAKMTSVERYLAKLEEEVAAAPGNTETAQQADTVSMTRVEKYLAKQQITASDSPQPEAVQPAAEKTARKPVAEVKKAPPKQAAEKQSPPAAKTSGKIINLAENASQCQSTTSKGTQCKRRTGLEPLEKTINQQKYRFVACGQHHSESFVPFPELLQND